MWRLAKLKLRRPPTSTVRTRTDGLTFEFQNPTQLISTLVMYEELVEPEFELLRKLITPSSVVIDVGAGIGNYSVFAASRVTGLVHVFEPTAESADMISRNAMINHVADRVVVHRIGLSDRSGHAPLVEHGRAYLNQIGEVSDDESGPGIEVTTLDRFCAEERIEQIDVLKVRVAGYEPVVFAGAKTLIEAGRIDVIILQLFLESIPLYKSFVEQGYQCYFTVAGRLQQLGSLEPDAILAARPSILHSNLVAVRGGALPEVNAALNGRA